MGIIILLYMVVAMVVHVDLRGEERGMEKAEREFLLWHDECADLRESAMRRYEEKMKGGQR